MSWPAVAIAEAALAVPRASQQQIAAVPTAAAVELPDVAALPWAREPEYPFNLSMSLRLEWFRRPPTNAKRKHVCVR
jgi:hypothetical protein